MNFIQIKVAFLNSLKILKCVLFLNYFTMKFIKNPQISLQDKINLDFVIENFDDLLSKYGINLNVNLAIRKKLWNNFLSLMFLIELILLIICCFIDPVDGFKYLIYLGDPTLLYESLRSYLRLILTFLFSFSIYVHYLFNYNTNIEWHEIFKCLDGHLTPESIGVMDKKILKQLLIFTKLSLKLFKFFLFSFIFIIMIPCVFYLFYEKIYFKIIHDISLLILMIIWILIISFVVYYMNGTLISAFIYFQIICFYCYINSRYFIKKVKEINGKLNPTSKKLVRLEINHLINEQNKFSIRIFKYNKFWKKFYFASLILLLPSHIISVHKSLFGDLNFQLRIILIFASLMGGFFTLFISLLACLVNRNVKIYGKEILQLYYKQDIYLNVKLKIKVKHQNFNCPI